MGIQTDILLRKKSIQIELQENGYHVGHCSLCHFFFKTKRAMSNLFLKNVCGKFHKKSEKKLSKYWVLDPLDPLDTGLENSKSHILYDIMRTKSLKLVVK